MTLAAILAVFCLASGSPPVASALPQSQGATSQTQTPPPASTTPATPPAQKSTKPSPKPAHHKKTFTSNCGSSPSTPNSGTSTTASSGAAKPCPPRKVVVRNGGSDPPAVELKGGTSAEQASQQRSTEQLAAAAQENLNKTAGQTLSPNQLELLNQIRQFLEQSKAAVAAGDPDRGHNLAVKAHLLSEELVKP